ncbi:MAG TPA: aroma-sacti cluster domain-containing protein [Gaiellaceae bacterium]|nr:aroma-sacti cluster domain-containing protein [Gaiellaceae bacterium]
MSDGSDKQNVVDVLRDAGIIYGDLPDEHRAVVERLSPTDVDLLVRVKKELDAADGQPGETVQGEGMPPFTTFMVF